MKMHSRGPGATTSNKPWVINVGILNENTLASLHVDLSPNEHLQKKSCLNPQDHERKGVKKIPNSLLAAVRFSDIRGDSFRSIGDFQVAFRLLFQSKF